MTSNELDVWENAAPALVIGGDRDFDIWENGAPVVEQSGTEVIGVRRRVYIF
jgi:hypothetical protein